MFYYGFDWTYLYLILPVMLIAMWAQFNVKGTFDKFSQVQSSRGYTGAQAARKILDSNGLTHVKVEHVGGHLSDHFDPKSNVIRLSDSVYGSASLAAIGVAAHEAGHAVQHAQGYAPIKLRNAFVPIANFGSGLSMPLFLLGMVFSWGPLMYAGIILFGATAIFQLLTLPVEFNASSRAVSVLASDHFVEGNEINGVKKVLNAAALTYVAALLTSLAHLFRLIILAKRRDNR